MNMDTWCSGQPLLDLIKSQKQLVAMEASAELVSSRHVGRKNAEFLVILVLSKGDFCIIWGMYQRTQEVRGRQVCRFPPRRN